MADSTQNVILRTRSLYKDFGGIRAVDNVDIAVYFGTVHSIIGPNGAGKTTLFNCLSGFLPPTGGEIWYREKNITRMPGHAISRLGITRSFQITSIFPSLTVLENVRIALQSRTKSNFNMFAGLSGLAHLEETAFSILTQIGLADMAGEKAANLDYGSKRCLEIGITLGTDPDLLMFDEPTSGAGPEVSRRIIELIRNIARGKTILLVEHNIDMVLQLSDTVTVLHQGKNIATGKPDEIQQDSFVREAYLGGHGLTS